MAPTPSTSLAGKRPGGEQLSPTSTCSTSSLVPAGPRDWEHLEMSPGSWGSGHRGQAQAAVPSFPLPSPLPS